MTETTTSATEQNAEPLLLPHSDNGMTHITLNRPANYNVLSEQMLAALQQSIDNIDQNERVVIIKATGKGLFYQQLEKPLSQAYALAGETMACSMMANDVVEGIDAFKEKRKAVWKHQ